MPFFARGRLAPMLWLTLPCFAFALHCGSTTAAGECKQGQGSTCPCPAALGHRSCGADSKWEACTCEPASAGNAGASGGSSPADAGPSAEAGGAGACAITCKEVGKNCGLVADNCGHQLSCGSCVAPSTCGDDHLCTGSVSKPLVEKQRHPLSVRFDADSVYWINQGIFSGDGSTSEGQLLKVAKSGGTPTVLADHLDTPNDLVLDATDVFFTVGDIPGHPTGTVQRVAKDGSSAAVTIADTQLFPTGIAVDDQSVYWLNQDYAAQGSAHGSLQKMPKAGGAPSSLTGSGIGQRLVLESDTLYWSARGGLGVAAGSIFSVSTSGANVQALASNQWQPNDLALDDTWIYFTNQGGSPEGFAVAKALKAGGGSAIPVVTNINLQAPFGIALDADSIYYTCAGTTAALTNQGQLRKIDKAGTHDSLLLDMLDHPMYLAVDGVSLNLAVAGQLGADVSDGQLIRFF